MKKPERDGAFYLLQLASEIEDKKSPRTVTKNELAVLVDKLVDRELLELKMRYGVIHDYNTEIKKSVMAARVYFNEFQNDYRLVFLSDGVQIVKTDYPLIEYGVDY